MSIMPENAGKSAEIAPSGPSVATDHDAKQDAKSTPRDALIHPFGVAKPLRIEPKTGDEALEHFNRPEYADIVLDVKGAGVFYAHRSYLKRSERFRSYSEGVFKEGSAPVVEITAPIPNQFYDVLWHLYTEKILPRWFGADQLAETLCTADYFMLDAVKNGAIKRFPSIWEEVTRSEFFAPRWIPLEIVSELISASEKIPAADKLRMFGTWFSRGDEFSPDPKVFDVVNSTIQIDKSLMPPSVQEVRKELGDVIFAGIVPSSYLVNATESLLKGVRKVLKDNYK
ncbi:hypothetical protein HK102_001602 [Quaeritorhiza haematococci]|nr:hypothetical protein HK102_001602 [Quaeritorhiza haematococci]